MYIHLVCICMWGPQDDVWFLLLLFSIFIIFIVILIQSLLLNLESKSLVGLGSEVRSICLFGNYHLCKPSLIPLLEYYNSGQLILFIKEFYNIVCTVCSNYRYIIPLSTAWTLSFPYLLSSVSDKPFIRTTKYKFRVSAT